MKNPNAVDSFNEIATARIGLKHTDPPIWREVEIPTSITLKVLHDIVQAAMGWLDYHLWEFVIDGRTYGLPMDEDWGTRPRKEARKVRLREVLQPGETLIDYVYDFGDSWEHEIRVSDIRKGTPEIGYPRYVAGARNGPPEDCGGVPGFYNLLDARADPAHPDHAHVVEWIEDHDPDLIEPSAASPLAATRRRPDSPSRQKFEPAASAGWIRSRGRVSSSVKCNTVDG